MNANAKINTSKGKQNKKHKHKTEVEKMLNVGVIGCGGMGKDHIKRLTEKIQGAQVVAVSDVFEEGSKRKLRKSQEEQRFIQMEKI